MSQPRTRICAYAYCDKSIVEQKPTRRRYCCDAHKQSAWRERHQLVAVKQEPVVHQHDRTGRKRGWVRPSVYYYGRWRHDFNRVHWESTLSDECWLEMAWEEIRREAYEDLLWALHPIWRLAEFQEVDRRVAVAIWVHKYANHPHLTDEGRLEILSRVPQVYNQARAAIEAEKEKQMIETVAAQNEEIAANQREILARQQETLDRLERLQDLAADTFARVIDTARRVGERFPDDAEVAAAVEQLIEDIGLEG